MTIARARTLGDTYRLARAAADWAGVTRLADISGLAGVDLPIFQAVRPFALSLTVSQGKGATALEAKISALLEAAELTCAETLRRPPNQVSLNHMPNHVREYWAGNRAHLAIDLDPAIPRAWVDGRLLGTDDPMPMPWDLLSLDFTRQPLEFPAGSDGLATGNTTDEAVLAALCELVEHDLIAGFEDMDPQARRAIQLNVESMVDPQLTQELARVRAAGFTPRFWSLGQGLEIAAIVCKLWAPEPRLDQMTPTGGSACHPDPTTATLAALREAVQGRAALVAGARDDIVAEDYIEGDRRALALTVQTLAVGNGPLTWSQVPGSHCPTAAEGVSVLQRTIARSTPLPVVVFDHASPTAGLHVVHALAPGLRNLSRRRSDRQEPVFIPPSPVRSMPYGSTRRVLFAGPSIAGLAIPPEIDIRPPAMCGDLAGLLADPPAAVGLIDGYFGLAPTVWHKEILDLLARGIRVMGAASIGALRAAELDDAGMEGVGAIYEAYRTGAIERDDAVMLLNAPEEFGFVPLTVALVDAEYALLTLACSAFERRAMQRIVRTTPFASRSWSRCLAHYHARTGNEFPFSADALAQVPSLKRHDAMQLIERLSGVGKQGPSGASPAPPTKFYLRMRARTWAAAVPVPA